MSYLKRFIKHRAGYFFVVFILLTGCAASSLTQSDTAGDTDLESSGSEPLAIPPTIAKLSPRIGGIADALIPYVSSEGADPDSSVIPYLGITAGGGGGVYLDYADDNAWAEYLDPGEGGESIVETIFGPSSTDNTPLRSMISRLEEVMTNIVVYEQGTEFTCPGDAIDSLESVDEIDVAFYGTVQNGTAGDRDYDCGSAWSDDSYRLLTIYGMDSDKVIRMAHMMAWSETSENNNGQPNQWLVMMATYAERVTDDGTAGFLDLHTNYSVYLLGDDDQEGTSDDSSYKVRSRITGTALFDGEDNLSNSKGDFSHIKYDWYNRDDNGYSATQTMGRGGYGAGEHSLFWIKESWSNPPSTDGDYFCLEHTTRDGLPASVASAHCTDPDANTDSDLNLESTFAWAAGPEFPFDLTPPLTAVFSDTTKFMPNDTDLISNSGDNFAFPDL
ncbi:MAG: hypothetical protein HQM16_15005 [Deltaproteobacteria bacterium]|nr:hypothetical protein [Deltaproteobacteria bacterium]